jgi:carboxymethylenebutenolidase
MPYEERLMPYERISISTRDGTCPSYVAVPDGAGPWPPVIFYTDAGGMRPAVVDMAQRLADAGYVVLLPDLFYRYGP